MTSRSERRIVCACGHSGYVRLSENDYPFSSLWEEYSLKGFAGNSITITNYSDMPDNILEALNPKCPKCGAAGMVSYEAN